MAKTSGLGDDFFIDGWHIGGDIQSLVINGGPAALDLTDITQSAHGRAGGIRAGAIKVVSFHDNALTGVVTSEHNAFSTLQTVDQVATYCRGQAIGNPAACCNAKQVNYDPTRAADGMLTFAVDNEGDGFGTEWGIQLTNGLRTDTAATNGASNDFGAASNSFGAQAYLQATALTGTDVTVTLQDSADNSTFANITGGAFPQITGALPNSFRIATANNLQIRRFVRAITTTIGGFTSFAFQVTIAVNQVATVF